MYGSSTIVLSIILAVAVVITATVAIFINVGEARLRKELTFKDEYGYIKEQSEKISYNGLEAILTAMDKAKTRIRANVNFDLAIEMMFLTIRDALNGKEQ